MEDLIEEIDCELEDDEEIRAKMQKEEAPAEEQPIP
jgi:hypothetical protein